MGRNSRVCFQIDLETPSLGGQNLNLDKGQFVDMRACFPWLRFNDLARVPGAGPNIFLGLFLNTWKRMLAHIKWSGGVMSPLVQCWERDQKDLRDPCSSGSVRPRNITDVYVFLEDPRGYFLTKVLRNVLVRGLQLIDELSSGCAL